MSKSAVVRSIDANYSTKATSRDGREILIRSIRPEDKMFFEDEFKHLSPESRYYRFFTPKTELTAKELKYFSELDFVNHVGLIAFIKDGGAFIAAGTGRYIVVGSDAPSISAEVAFDVKEEYQNNGIATILLAELTVIARNSGIRRFIAYVISSNTKMLSVFRACQWKFQKSIGAGGVLTLIKDLDDRTSGPQNHSLG